MAQDKLNLLIAELRAWCASHDLPHRSADELLADLQAKASPRTVWRNGFTDDANMIDRLYLHDFMRRWEEAE